MSIDYFGLAWKISFPRKPLKKLVLLALADHHNDEIGFSWPSYKTIATRTGISRRTVISLIAELEADGFVSRVERHKVGHLNTSNAYYLNEARMKTAAAQSETTSNGEPASPPTTKTPADGEASAPSGRAMVSDPHHNGDQPAPSMVIDPHHNGDLRAPKLLSNPLCEPLGETLSTAAAPADPAPPAAAAADPLTPILDWLGFDDALTPKERATLDQATLLAWSMWAKLKQAESRGRITNPIGWVRSQWRSGRPVRADLLNLARGWLALNDDARARLLGRLEWASDYGGPDPGAALEDDFPDIPARAAAAVYAATGGQLAPPSLSPAAAIPVCPPDRPTPAAQTGNGPHRSVPQTAPDQPASTLWRDALAEIEMQTTRATFDQLLRGTTAAEDANGLTVHVRNAAAAEWLEQRLHPVVQRTVDALAGRPLPVHYAAPQEAKP